MPTRLPPTMRTGTSTSAIRLSGTNHSEGIKLASANFTMRVAAVAATLCIYTPVRRAAKGQTGSLALVRVD